jgi:hypothetical protein
LRPGDIVQIGALFAPAASGLVAAPPAAMPGGGQTPAQAPARMKGPENPPVLATPIAARRGL